MLIERLPLPAVGTGLPPMVATLAAGLDVMMAAGAGVVAAAVIWGRMVEMLPGGTVVATAVAVGRVPAAGAAAQPACPSQVRCWGCGWVLLRGRYR